MLSPLGRNAQFCCSRYGVKLENIEKINFRFICKYITTHTNDDTVTFASALRELILIKANDSSFSSSDFSSHDVDLLINGLSHLDNCVGL